MALLELAFKILLLAGPPLGTLIGIHRAKTFWPLAFLTLIGTTVTVINFRIAAQLSALQSSRDSSPFTSGENFYHGLSWFLGITILFLGLRKVRKARRAHALEKLFKEEK